MIRISFHPSWKNCFFHSANPIASYFSQATSCSLQFIQWKKESIGINERKMIFLWGSILEEKILGRGCFFVCNWESAKRQYSFIHNSWSRVTLYLGSTNIYIFCISNRQTQELHKFLLPAYFILAFRLATAFFLSSLKSVWDIFLDHSYMIVFSSILWLFICRFSHSVKRLKILMISIGHYVLRR